MKKKVLSLLVTFAMLFSMLPATALAADFNVTADGNDLNDAESNDYYTFDEVLTHATAEDTIIIKEDITADTAFTVTDTTIDLGGNTLKIGAGGNYFKGDVTVKNGTIDISGVTANGDCIMGIGDRSADATLTLSDVDLTGTDYSSAFAVLMVYGDGTLNVTGGEWTLTGEKGSAGGVIKNESGAGDSGNVNITGTTMKFDDVARGIAGATVVLDSVDLTITGGDNGINGSKLTVKNGSEITITGGTGRALTVTDYDVTVENSTLNFSGNEEADIRFKSSNTLTVDTNSTLSECSVIADSAATAAKVNDTTVTGTETAPQSVSVADGETTIKTAPKGNVPTGYTTETKIWGETWSNAQESYVIKIYSGDTLMGTTTLNPDVYTAFDGDVSVTWHISFDPSTDTDEYWIQEWTVAPSLIMQPDKVVLCVDGVDVSEGEIQMNGPDNINKIVAATADSTGSITGYYTNLADALTAAADGGTVRLIYSEGDAPIPMNGALYGNKTVTITGTAEVDWSKGWLFVGRGGEGDGTLIFEDAILTSNETSLANGSYGIHVSAPEKDSTEKNIGKVIFENSDVQLSYLANRSNVVVDGGKLYVHYGFWVGGRPASETPDGIDGTATMDIKNKAVVEVKNHNGMGIGHESKGVLNVNGATFNYTGTSLNVAEGSTIAVSGESTINANVTGSGWVYMNGVTLGADTKLIGAKVGFINGKNTIKGSTIDDGWFSVGIGKNNSEEKAADKAAAFAEANGITLGDVVVNVSGNAVIGANGNAYNGWVGSAYSADKTLNTYELNIEESVATFGYLHVSKDGVLNVKGDVAEEDKANIASGNYTFYVGDFIVNGVATLDDVDTRVQYGKISVDNADTGESAGTLNIKNCDEIVFATEGNTSSALKWWNSGIVNVENSTVSARTPNITATGALNLVGSEFSTSSTAITNAGTITMDAASKITATDIAGDGKVAIDATSFAGTTTVIDINNGSTTLTDNKITISGDADAKRDATDGDVILVNVGEPEENTLYVNTEWDSQDDINAVLGNFSGYVYGENVFNTLPAAFDAAESGNTVEIMSAGTYELSTSGKDITITGSVDGVVFDNIGAKNMGGANVTFNNVTFDYYPNTTYTGLQHSGNLTYNDCTINGQVFLYGASENFNNCTFNQDSADAYNVWTYGAKVVAFNECTFNSVGKSVLVYNEGACATDLTVTDTEFNASAPVEGKAAIEIDTSLMPEGTDIVVDAATTASGFDTGSVSGNSLWNDKKDQTNLTVTVGEEQVWPIAVAQIGNQKFYSLQDAVNAAADNESVTITLLTDTSEAARIDIGSKKDITIVGQANGEGEYPAFTGWFKVTGELTLKDVTLVAPSTAVPGETVSQYTKTVISLVNTGDVVCENVTFDMSNAVADSTAITAWWSTGDGANITVTDCTFDCAGQRPIRSDACVTVKGCTFNDPYRYAVQMTSKSSTMAEDAEAYVVFNNNTIVDGENGKEYVYGVQLEGGYGCSDLTITGTGNTITADANDGSTLYFVENTDKMGFETIQWKTEAAPVLKESTFAAKIAGTDGDIYLPTLAEAIEHVAADGTVTLVANNAEEIEVSKALTIELNGFTAEKVAPADGYAVVKYETKWVFGTAGFVVPATGVTLSGTTSVKVGNTTTLTATVAPDNATNKNVTWTSSDTSVATVADGVVTGVAAGTATITVTTEDGGFTADCTVTVSRASSGGGGGGGSTSYTIAVEDTKNGGITVSPSRASSGSTVTITVNPNKGYVLETLTVLDKNGKEVDLTKKADNKYTFKMPSGKVTVEATFMEDNTMLNYFTDVFASDYYYDAVLWAVENGITNGTSATTFSPSNPCTRAQMATFLWRAAGSPEPVGSNNPFVDVPADAYYAKAVQWAYEQGITGGTSATTFSPDQTCTRGQMATFLWRDAGSSAVSGEGAPFVDIPDDVYYATAVDWAYEEGITGGTSATTYSPNDPCTRGQMVTFLYRYLAD